MTALSPATPVLPHLEKVGAYLQRADIGLGGGVPKECVSKVKRRENAERIRLEAQLRASVDLDGAYSVSPQMVHLLRALEAICELETSPATRQGSSLLNAAFYLREAGRSVQAAVRAREVQAA